MNKNHFMSVMGEIYASFGKKTPEMRILEAIFTRIGHLPDEFMAYVRDCMVETEMLPANMGKFILRDLWPEYLEKHPELRSLHETIRCPLCTQDMPGWRRVYKPEMTVIGLRYVPEIIRCTCGNARNPHNEKIWQDHELESLGFKLQCPYRWSDYKVSDSLLKLLGRYEEDDTTESDTIDNMGADDWQA